MTRKITIGLIVATAAVWIGWDLFAFFDTSTAGDTESEVIRDFATKSHALPFAFGVLGGHFFWTTKKKIWSRLTLIPLVLIAITIFVLDVVGIRAPLPSIAFLAAGTIAGRLFWAQHVSNPSLNVKK